MNTTDNIVEKKIAVLLSGGVDSSVVVYELARRGLKPDCFYIKIGPEEEAEWDCTSEEDLEMATAVASRYGCRLEVVDCHKEYWDRVTRYTMDKVRAGFTPNPDVMCNRLIKFGAFHEKRGRDYDLIATGHYACTETDAEGRKWLVTSPDPVKDQTDFLAQIYDWQLRKALFPIGHYVKDEVREIALREHLVTARRKDSQGICFVGKVDLPRFLQQKLAARRGNVHEILPSWRGYGRAVTGEDLAAMAEPYRYTVRDGKKIGEHDGAHFYTIGERKGLGIGGRKESLFVLATDVEQNVIWVGEGDDHPGLYRRVLFIRREEVHWVNPVRRIEAGGSARFAVRIRYRQPLQGAELRMCDAGAYVVFDTPQRGITPGQFAAWYDGDELVGSGVIDR